MSGKLTERERTLDDVMRTYLQMWQDRHRVTKTLMGDPKSSARTFHYRQICEWFDLANAKVPANSSPK